MIEGTALDEAPYAAALPILMPLPDRDFDPTEAAIPWKTCTSRGFGVAFSTENGSVAEGDLRRLEGPLPGLVSASWRARAAYREMTEDPAFGRPIPMKGSMPLDSRGCCYPEATPSASVSISIAHSYGARCSSSGRRTNSLAQCVMVSWF